MPDYSCRACGKSLQATKGCAICNPIRPNLIVHNVTDVSLAEISKEAVVALRSQLTDYKDMLHKDVSPKTRDSINTSIRAVTSAISKILDSARKIQEDGAKAISLMSLSEQIELFKGFYAELPSLLRKTLLDDLSVLEEQINSNTSGWKDLANELTPN